MPDTKFTPGPWGLAECSEFRVMAMGGKYPTYICDTANNTKTRTPENAANAHLIAAAPKLYAALEQLLFACNTNNFMDTFAEEKARIEAEEYADEILKAARGEQ